MKVDSLRKRPTLRVVGIMSGTSLDGVDFVLVRVEKSKNRISLVGKASALFPNKLRDQLMKAVSDQLSVYDLGRLHHDLGRFYSRELKKIVSKKRWQFDAIGLHGQTVFHETPGSTLQIGESSYLSAEFKKPVIADFRTGDLAVHGEGAPLAPLFHKVAFARHLKSGALSVQNLGGIANCTFIEKNGAISKAFDTGPANMLMDLLIQKSSKGKTKFDKDGHIASRGVPLQKIVDHALRQKYFKQKPPKSCGREEFGKSYLEQFQKSLRRYSLEDQMATLLELTTRSIAEAYKEFGPKKLKTVVLCGGGAYNLQLKKRLQYHVPQARVVTSQDLGWPPDSIEGAAFALLAAYRIWNWPSNIPSATGSQRKVSLGKITEVF